MSLSLPVVYGSEREFKPEVKAQYRSFGVLFRACGHRYILAESVGED